MNTYKLIIQNAAIVTLYSQFTTLIQLKLFYQKIFTPLYKCVKNFVKKTHFHKEDRNN
jgi:hypothetical protein